jgi:hypothetical protein
MDPITIGLLAAMGAGGAAAVARWRRRRRGAKGERVEAERVAARKESRANAAAGEHRVGDVLLHMGDEYWLAGELALMREGSAAMRVCSAPEKGKERWLAFPREGESLYVLRTNERLAAMGWPGVEVPFEGMVLRPVEQGACAIAPAGEVERRWEGVGRYAVFRAMETVAVVIEQGTQRLALTGKAVPRRLFEKLG